MSPSFQVLVHGAGIIGVSLALELRQRGIAVQIADPGRPLAQASTAAAGMLAAEDPTNPLQLQALARYSLTLYPGFLHALQQLSGLSVPLQTTQTRQVLANGSIQHLAEHSLDPRQLAQALLRAREVLSIPVIKEPAISAPEIIVHAKGAWSDLDLPVTPRKGQMLRVALPEGRPLTEVLRSAHTYIVPRTRGPQAGTALVGATVEDAGYDLTLTPDAPAQLRRSAADLLPGLDDAALYPEVERWAGLRPATPDELPILGELAAPGAGRARLLVATGHYRNGILLAPATAAAMADLIEGRTPAVDLGSFSPARFGRTVRREGV